MVLKFEAFSLGAQLLNEGDSPSRVRFQGFEDISDAFWWTFGCDLEYAFGRESRERIQWLIRNNIPFVISADLHCECVNNQRYSESCWFNVIIPNDDDAMLFKLAQPDLICKRVT